MMKRMLAVLLVMVMALGLTGALAEETVDLEQATNEFDITMVIPEGYSMWQERINDILFIDVSKEDETAPIYSISIAFSEIYDGRTLMELSEEEQDELIAVMEEGYEEPIIRSETTKEGTMVFVLDENASESDYALVFTVYQGYFIQVYIATPNFEPLKEQDIQLAIDLLSDMHFVDR